MVNCFAGDRYGVPAINEPFTINAAGGIRVRHGKVEGHSDEFWRGSDRISGFDLQRLPDYERLGCTRIPSSIDCKRPFWDMCQQLLVGNVPLA